MALISRTIRHICIESLGDARPATFQDGTVHLNHRFHSTFTMGFTQPDPSRQELNNYAYAACVPINNTDPTGLQTWGQCVAGYTLAAGVGTAVAVAGPLILGGTAAGGPAGFGAGAATVVSAAGWAAIGGGVAGLILC